MRTLEYNRITPRVAAMSATQVNEIVLDYVERRLTPKTRRGGQKEWAAARGLTSTDIYGVLQRAGHAELVGGGMEDARAYAEKHGLLRKQQPQVVEVEESKPTFLTSTMPVSGLTLDGALLDSMIRAEVARAVTSLKGEIELHVRRETQAAIERATERGVSTLMRSLETTLDQIIEASVTRALDEYTSS